MLTPQQLAAQLSDPALIGSEAAFEIDAAIAQNDLAAIWKPATVAKLAAADDVTRGGLLAKIRVKWGTAADLANYRKAIRREQSNTRLRQAVTANGTLLSPIQTNGRPLRDMARDSMAALRQFNEPATLFCRSAAMVHVEKDECARPSIIVASPDYLRGRMDRSANFLRRGEATELAVYPPMDVVRDMMALAPHEWELPPLDVVVEAPALRAGGTILDTPGYDAASRMYYSQQPGFSMVPVPVEPTTDDVDEAVAWIDDAIGEFPFTDAASRANFFGLLLTPVIRPAIDGCTPIALLDAPQSGTGKTLLADVFAIIVTGREAAMKPYPRDEQEMKKLIGATVMEGRGLVCFDNLEGPFNSPTMALILTCTEFEDRILGTSTQMRVPNRATWLVTGNNIRPGGDMPRRCYHIRLDARSSKPYTARKFKHENLKAWTHENRAELLRALLVMARYWYSVGSPLAPDISPLGSFESWQQTVASILHACRVVDFMANALPLYGEGDEDAMQWERLLGELWELYPEGQAFEPGDIANKIRTWSPMGGACAVTLPDSLGRVDMRSPRGLDSAIGRSFMKRVEKRHGVKEWYLTRVVDRGIGKWKVMNRDTEKRG